MRIVDVKNHEGTLYATAEWDGAGPVKLTYVIDDEEKAELQRIPNKIRDGGFVTLVDGGAYLDALIARYSGAYSYAEERGVVPAWQHEE